MHDSPVAAHNAAETTSRASKSDAGGLGEVCASSHTPTERVHGEGCLPGARLGQRNVTRRASEGRLARRAPGPMAPTIRYATANRDHDPVIFLTEERLLSAVSPLGDTVGHARSYPTRQSSHGGKPTRPQPRVKSLGMVSPELPTHLPGGPTQRPQIKSARPGTGDWVPATEPRCGGGSGSSRNGREHRARGCSGLWQ